MTSPDQDRSDRSAYPVVSDRATEVDLLGRWRYVESLADIAASSETPLVIAVYGEWGSGKTSMLRQIRRALEPEFDSSEKHAPPRARTIWFDPWMHQFDRTPALGLLHATTNQLGISDSPRATEALKRIAVALSEDIQIPYVGVRVGRLLKIREELASDEFRRREEQARLQGYFHEVLRVAGAPDTRLVFFIDDLDRCQPSVALSLLEALKLYLDFPGCVYVLGVDREPLEAAIGSSYAELGLKAESYLDKIVQVPFAIPRIDADAMHRYIDEWIPGELDPCRELLAAAGTDDPRQVKRILNSLLINHRLVDLEQFADGYDPRILTVLILVQNFAPALYRLVRLNSGLIHDVYRGKTTDASEADRALWVQHVATRPRLDVALRLVELPGTLDITPYLTLTAAFGYVPGKKFDLEVDLEEGTWANRISPRRRRPGFRRPRASRSGRDLAAPVDVQLAAPVDVQRDWVRGPEKAMVTLVEYGDFECPYCGQAEPIIRELLASFDDDLRYVWRHLPLDDVHPNAQLAAEATEAAAAQGKFWNMHDALLSHQGDLSPRAIRDLARELGLDVQRFWDEVVRHEHAPRVAEDVASADASGVLGTPSFFINGQRHYGAYDIETLSSAVQQARARAAAV